MSNGCKLLKEKIKETAEKEGNRKKEKKVTYQMIFLIYSFELREEYPNTEFSLARIFLYLD